MKRIALALAATAIGLGTFASAGETAVPTLKDLRKPVEIKTETVDEGPILPNSVNPDRRVADPARVCPAGAVWYTAVSDSKRMVEDWDDSPPGLFMSEPALRLTMRNNRFGLGFLFSDLPESVITAERVGAVASAIELSGALAAISEKMAMGGYIDEEGRFSFVFLFDVGLNRVPAFETLTTWETSFYLAFPGTNVVRGDHSGNFIDVWTMRESANAQTSAVIGAGFAENIAVVSNSEKLAKSCLDLLNGGENIAESSWGRRLAASVATSTTADAIGFVRMDALLDGLKEEPIARQAVASWADYFGHGGKDGEAMYYGLQFTPEGTRETFLLPVSSQPASSSLVELLAKRLRPAAKWTTPTMVPYQPNPAMFLAAQLEGRQLGGLLRQERRLFGLSNSNDYFVMPPAARRLLTNEVVALLTGEVGMAFYPDTATNLAAVAAAAAPATPTNASARGRRAAAGAPNAPSAAPGTTGTTAGTAVATATAATSESVPYSWLMVLPCTENPEKLLPKAESQIERSGAVISSRVTGWRTSPSWTVITTDNIRRAGGHFLIVASHGDLILSAIDQVVSGSSFSNNRDFSTSLEQTEAGHGLIFYINAPEIVIREYPNLSYIMRSIYPRSSGFNSRPPLALLRRYAKGIMGAISPANGNGNGSGSFTRVTVQAPIPMLGALAAGVVLRFPMSMRADGRVAMQKSRDNLQSLWLRIQLYSSRFGHFPESLDLLMSEMRNTMTPDEVRSAFIAPAALSRLTPEEAMKGSYRYLSGVTPNDEPDIPILYEAEAWSEDFSGMFPDEPNRAPNETGTFQPYRQLIRLDGKIVVMPEKWFQERMLSRMRERE